MKIATATIIRINELCHQHRMTVYELAKNTGVPKSTLSSIMSGRIQNPGLDSISKVADGFDMTIRDFFDSELFDCTS